MGLELDVSATPGVLEWQPRRCIVPAPHELHGREDLTPTVAPIGEFFAPEVCIDADALLRDDAESEDIEMVVKAERSLPLVVLFGALSSEGPLE